MEHWDKSISLEELMSKDWIVLDRGKVISSKDLANYPGSYPVYSSSAQNNGFFGAYDLYDFDEELITWSVDGGGYFFYRPKHKFSVTNVAGILRILNDKKLNYKFLYYLLSYQHSKQAFDYVEKAHPSVIKRRYFVPEISLSEQTQIASLLSKVDDAITQTEQLIAKYTRIKMGLMQDLLTKGIDEHGNIRNEEKHEFKDSPIGKIPKEWDCIPFEQLATFKNGLNYSKSQEGKGLKIIGVSDFKDHFSIDYNELSELYLKNVSPSYILKNGDLLFVRSNGNKELVGRVLFISGLEEKVAFSGFTIKATVNANVNSKYIAYLFTFSQTRLQLIKGGGGTNINNLSQEVLGKIFLNVPKSESEQNRIIKIIDKQYELIKHAKESLHKLESLKTGLMQDLLSGKVNLNYLAKETTSL